MIRTTMSLLTLAFVASLGLSVAASAQENDKLLIVNGNSGRVIYDDGRNDMFCVTRRHVVGYTWSGHRVYRRTMRCR